VTSLCFVTASAGNYFMTELLEAVASEARALGASVTSVADHFPDPEPDSAFLVEPVPPVDPAPVDQHNSGTEPAPEPVFEPVALEENEPLPSSVEEAIPAPAGPDPGEGTRPLPDSLETAVSGAVETLESAATDVLGSLADGSVLPDLFSGGEADLPAGEDSGSSPGGTGDPSRDTPQPFSPFKLLLPTGSDFFSLSGGEIGSGGAPLLLLCVLASSLALLRRERKLLWPSRELPKPSSVPCPALERPG
jgi:hypothetical protein